MYNLLVFLAIFQFLSGPSITAQESLATNWLLASDFKPSEIANLTAAEEHKLLLKSLLKERRPSVRIMFRWELFARTSGIEFCGVVENETLNRESTAFVRAAFESFTKLQLQDQVIVAVDFAFRSASLYLNETGDLGMAFALVCSTIDARLNNQTFYTTLVKEFMNKDTWQPKKVYLQGIPKTEDEFRKALTDFANAPQLKKFLAHSVFIGHSYGDREEMPGKRYIKRLAALPGKTEAVQKIYEEAIQELTGQIKDISEDKVEFNQHLGMNLSDLAPILDQILKAKIYANPDLKSLVEQWLTQDSATTTPEPVTAGTD